MSKWSFDKLLSIIDAVVAILKFAVNSIGGAIEENV